MTKSEQYEFFQSLVKTNEKLNKAYSEDKTTDAIIADIADPDSKAKIIPKQGNPTTTSMVKGMNPKEIKPNLPKSEEMSKTSNKNNEENVNLNRFKKFMKKKTKKQS
jgi:hypothetical protein